MEKLKESITLIENNKKETLTEWNTMKEDMIKQLDKEKVKLDNVTKEFDSTKVLLANKENECESLNKEKLEL